MHVSRDLKLKVAWNYIACFIDDSVEARLLQLIPAVDATKPAAHNKGVDIKIVGVWPRSTAALSVLVEFSLDLHIGIRGWSKKFLKSGLN